jgi:hypothetical protein
MLLAGSASARLPCFEAVSAVGATLICHVGLVRWDSAEPEMPMTFIFDATDNVDTSVVIPDASTHVTGMPDDQPDRRQRSGGALPCDVMSQYIASAVVRRRRQSAVSSGLRSARPEVAIAIENQAIPDFWPTPSPTATRVEIAVAATESALANLDLIWNGEEVGAAPLTGARDGTLYGHRTYPPVSDPGCLPHAGVTSCPDFTTSDQIGQVS